MKPFYSRINFEKGLLLDYDKKVIRRISDIIPYVSDSKAAEEMAENDDKIVYEVLQRNVPQEPGHIQHSITIIKPGNIQGELFMTKGHYHGNEQSAEIYLGLRGRGLLVMQKDEQTEIIEMRKGTAAYIPPKWAHRTININADQDFVFMSFFPGDAGYDYKKLQQEGINIRIMKDGDNYKEVNI